VISTDVWVRVAAPAPGPPGGPAELGFVLLSTRTPAVGEFSGGQSGQTPHYMLRWIGTRAEAGPWSEAARATVGAQ